MRFFYSLLIMLLPLFVGNQTDMPVADPQEAPQGIDVSRYQKRVEWDSVASVENMEFAFVKATEGADYIDTSFAYNWEALGQRGMRRGAYHFFRAHGCGYDQAMHFLKTVEMCPGDLPPVLDVEKIDGMPPEVLLEEMRIWLQTVEKQLHCKPIIYTYQNFYERYLAGVFDNHPIWIARYSDEKPVLTTGKQWHFWQFSNYGRIKGVPTNVDLNVFFGTRKMLDQMAYRPQSDSLETGIISAP